MTRQQRQRSGSGSQQIQVAGNYVVNVNGVSEERAVEIAKEQADIAIREFTAEANSIARDRMDSLDQKVVRELSERGLLQTFADPAFQILLRKAQLHAAATSDDDDHDRGYAHADHVHADDDRASACARNRATVCIASMRRSLRSIGQRSRLEPE